MARERKELRDMNRDELRDEFGKALGSRMAAILHLGEIVHYLLRDFREGWAPMVRYLRDSFPNAEDRFGVKLTQPKLKQFHDLWRSLSGEGLISPDRRHVVTAEMLQALGLDAGELQALVEAAHAGRVRIADIEKECRRAQGGIDENDSRKVEKAQANIAKLLAPPEPSHAEQVAALVNARRSQVSKIEKAQAEIARIDAELEVLQRAVEPTAERAAELEESGVIPPQSEVVAAIPAAE